MDKPKGFFSREGYQVREAKGFPDFSNPCRAMKGSFKPMFILDQDNSLLYKRKYQDNGRGGRKEA
jgi:hypothetical protein